MSLASSLSATTPLPRVLGHLRGALPGPLLVVVGSIHGNEPAGALAAIEVLRQLSPLAERFRGDLVALAGNRTALARGCRFVHRDLNRGWSPDALRELGRFAAPGICGDAPAVVEDEEQRELARALEEALAAARGPVYFLDLHTTSAGGVPFALADDTPASRSFGLAFGLPLLLGLQGLIGRTLSSHMADRGAVSISLEGGQNEDPRSVEHHAAAILVALESAGIATASEIPGLDAAKALLESARRDLPRLLQVNERHAIAPEDAFRMVPGFANIHAVRTGELLAHDRRGEVRAQAEGYVVMPLYQGLGDDGFFFGRIAG